MPDLEQARLYIVMAKKDLDAVKRIVGDDGFAEEVFGFHAQQAAEKAMKAWLCVIGQSVPRTHDLEYLELLLNQRGAQLPNPEFDVALVTSFGVTFRYEPYPLSDGALDRSWLAEEIEKIVRHVESVVESTSA